MTPQLLVIFNHSLTAAQREDATITLGVSSFIEQPSELAAAWSQMPADAPSLAEALAPFFQWLAQTGRPGDYVLIQGDFGATFLLVQKALALGLRPLYSTTRREAVEVADGDSVRLTHQFRHVRFRLYEAMP